MISQKHNYARRFVSLAYVTRNVDFIIILIYLCTIIFSTIQQVLYCLNTKFFKKKVELLLIKKYNESFIPIKIVDEWLLKRSVYIFAFTF